jgi:hypothetical protein
VSHGFTWLCVRPCEVRQVGDTSAFKVRWLDDPKTWHTAALVCCTPRATLLRLLGAWLLLTYTAPPVAYRDEPDARAAYAAVA